MQIKLNVRKSLNEIASDYFDQSKKAKLKRERVQQALQLTQKKLEQFEHVQAKAVIAQAKIAPKRSLEWFEKFRWFYTSQGLLVVCGRDASQNEAIVKKYMEPQDIYFHAEIQGAPHCILKPQSQTVSEESKQEAAQFAGLYSKAWQSGFATVDVYSVKPDQVSKQAPTGESMGKGAFMIYGKRDWFKKINVQCALALEETPNGLRVIAGPKKAIQSHVHSSTLLEVVPGKEKPGALAKKVKKFFDTQLKRDSKMPLDEIIRMLPAGNSELVRVKRSM